MSRQGHGATRPVLIGASAGSGKTHRLTEEVVHAVASKDAEAIDPEALVAVTYTRRAAAELGARVRRKLVEEGAHDRARRLPLAYLGTVHGVCLRLVQEFAIDAGLSPRVDVLPGDEARWLREALECGLSLDFREKVQSLADRLQLRLDGRSKRTDWLTPVQDIMTLARSNRIAPSSLLAMAERSTARLLALLGPPERDGASLDRELLKALEQAEREFQGIDDGVGKTKTAHESVRNALRAFREDRVAWGEWVKLQKLSPAKAVVSVVAPVVAVASRVDRHPDLHADVRDLTLGIYEAARTGLEAYDAWKKKRGVVDFVDMVDRALTLTEKAEVQDELGARLRLLVVDEFQDTSPVQLALFVRMHQIAGRSTWVGDRKQCIFEFAGADPMLMEAVTQWAGGAGEKPVRLESNWRSRPELVDACSHLFAGAFERHGYRRDEVVVKAERRTPPALAALPPLGLWWIEAANQDQTAHALADGVCRLLATPSATPVVDRTTNEVRDLRPRDVAILVATNAESDRLATALALRGVRATVARAGLLATPEGTLVRAALSALVDPRDTLSRAIIEALTGWGGQTPDAWLDEHIAREVARREAHERGDAPSPPVPSRPSTQLDSLRTQLDALAPSEALDGVLSAFDVAALCARWPDPEQRLSNLDALRAMAAAYEERCAQQREAATIAGLLRYFDEAGEKKLVRDEEIASDDQHVGAGDHAVTIVTYHRAKGLEWPVVILSSLDRGEKRDAFEVCPETDRAAFDATDPLGGRWIRYWPWPFGQQQTTRLAEIAAASPEGKAVELREERERVRLLYVGFTRARDHLILAARYAAKGSAAKWLDELCDANGKALLALPGAADASEVSVVGMRGPDGKALRVPARHWMLGTDAAARKSVRWLSDDDYGWFARPKEAAAVRPPYWIAPSQVGTNDLGEGLARVAPKVGAVVSIGERLPLGNSKGISWDVVGDAVHAFLAADVLYESDGSKEQRLERAERLLAAAGLRGLLEPEALLRAGDQLRAWVESHWPGATWHREYPVTGVVSTPLGARRVRGTIDLLLETPDGVVLVDHKSFPGGAGQWAEKAEGFAPQLAAYATVVGAAGQRVIGTYVHFPIGAGIVRLG